MCPCIGKNCRRLLGLSFIPEKLSCHPAVSSQWPWTIKCVVGSSLDFSNAGRQTSIPTSVIKKVWKTHYKILLSAAPLSPGEILLDVRIVYHSLTTATYLMTPIPLASSEFSCFSLHCWRSCTWRSQSDTCSPCSVFRCDYRASGRWWDTSAIAQHSQPGQCLWCELQPLPCHSLQWSPLAGRGKPCC